MSTSLGPLFEAGARMQYDVDATRIAALEARVAALAEVLRRAEWVDMGTWRGGFYCASCDASESSGHRGDCQLAAALREGEA